MNKRTFLKTLVGATAAGPNLLLRNAKAEPEPTGGAGPARQITTTAEAPWQTSPAPEPDATATGQPDLAITPQFGATWKGFGGCFNELGWRALQTLPAAARDRALDRLFHPQGDLRFEFCRLPIGGNDYSEDWYSYAPVAGDFALDHFTIERDRRLLLPYVHAALQRRPGLEFFASPWSPPEWFKRPALFNTGRLIMQDRYLDAYARYLTKYVSAYAAEGVRVGQVHVQNEPATTQKFPSCVMTGDELRRFIGGHLGPTFAAQGCPAEIWLGTLNAPDKEDRMPGGGFNEYAFQVMEDPRAARYVRGISYQWAGGRNALDQTRQAYPNLPMIQSENECGDGANTWHYAWYVAHLFQHYLMHDVSAYCYWNMVLAPGGLSTWGWAQNALLTANAESGEAEVNPEYHIMRHYSGFIRRGDRRCVCERPWSANAVAFRGPSGSTKIVVRNPLAERRTVSIACGGRRWRAQLAARSLSTLVLP